MTRIKFCGLTRMQDIEAVNGFLPEYIGFVFYKKSKRYVTFEKAGELKKKLNKSIKAVGVFVDEAPGKVAEAANNGIIDIIQLHGQEDDEYVKTLRDLTDAKIIKAFQIKQDSISDDEKNGLLENIIKGINEFPSDMVLVDSGQGTGKAFNWDILRMIERDYFLAGGINRGNIEEAVLIHPYAIDVSSGIETDGIKDEEKMRKMISAVRNR
ncbi:phosphoribosylanthranilate isomerase [Butyrivibrio sp. AE3004]|uniref:phosphoribosylanthranilate isomerase n=1 Tax=Butyrivibrio sp. AE3004 TaxID=1506994 RepID=UPI0004942299|nr:phosphoribosylanthranilate isomerase [Butyrivibrio sp. AE3004]